MDGLVVFLDGARDLFDGDPRPVGDLEVGARIGVEERRLAAVGVADEADGHLIAAVHRVPPRLRCSS